MIDFDWRQQTDDVVEEGTVHAYDQSMRLCRAGILAGPSTGLALAGLLEISASGKTRKTILPV